MYSKHKDDVGTIGGSLHRDDAAGAIGDSLHSAYAGTTGDSLHSTVAGGIVIACTVSQMNLDGKSVEPATLDDIRKIIENTNMEVLEHIPQEFM